VSLPIKGETMPGQQGTSQDQSVDAGIDRKLQTTTIGETLANIEECSAFRKLVQDADLDYVLRRSGLRTLLAPRNDALTNFSTDETQEFLNQHLLSGAMESFDLERRQNVKTIAGHVLPVEPEDGTVRIGKAAIVKSDIPCTNGVIHVVDALVGS
jgi:uncharacterized surface protein with fasciclin (FAS1) repeats